MDTSIFRRNNYMHSYIQYKYSKTEIQEKILNSYSEHVVTFVILCSIVILDVEFAEEVKSENGVEIDDHAGENNCEHQLMKINANTNAFTGID